MARQPRIALAGRPHLLSQTSHDNSGAFIDDDDRRFYLAAMFECSRTAGVAVHAYVLTDRQVWLLATPQTADALGRFMQRLGRRYVHAFHQRHGTVGKFWSSRYGSAALLSEQILLRALLMVEQLPVREAISAAAGDGYWSSAAHHLGIRPDSRLVDPAVYWSLGNTPFERQARYAETLRTHLPLEQTGEWLAATRSGWPLGPEDVLDALESELPARALRARPRGRPPKGT